MKAFRQCTTLALAGITLALLPGCTSTGSKSSTGATRTFTALKLGTLRGLAIDAADNLYVPNPKSPTALHKITPSGVATVLPTEPIRDLFAVAIAPDGTIYACESIYALAHRLGANGATPLAPATMTNVFLGPTALACDAAGNLYVAENDCNLIRKVTPAGQISIYAGAFRETGSKDGPAAEARFTTPRALTIDHAGNLYVGDEKDFIIRKISKTGIVTTLAGKVGANGSQNGKGADARFAAPRGLATDQAGNLYIADTPNHTIRKMTPTGVVTTIAGRAGASGFADGSAAAARFNNPRALAVDSAGNIYVGDSDNHAVRRISLDGTVSTVAGVLPN